MQTVKTIVAFLLGIFIINTLKAQTPTEQSFKNKVLLIISNEINSDKIKDSAAVYTFCIKIDVQVENGKQSIYTKVNDIKHTRKIKRSGLFTNDEW